MPIPSAISDLSTTPSLNSPAGSESPALVDDYLRTHAAFIKQVSDSKDTLDAANVKLTGNQTIAGTKTFSSAPVVPGLNGGQLAGMRNKIINGKMEIAQRGASFAAIANGDYSLDRWVFEKSTTAVITASQQADIPSGNEFQSSLRLAVTTADTSISSTDYCLISQRVEGYNVRDLIGRTFTLSFCVRSSKTGVHCVAMRNSGTDRSYVAEYTVNAANTWETKTITVPGGLITAGTWNWTNGAGLFVSFVLAAGTTFQTTAGSWQTGNFIATANQVNCLDTVGNIFAITGVQLEVGSVATPFEHRPIGAELALCQRYYERNPNASAAYPQATVSYMRIRGNNQDVDGTVYFSTTKRANPTVNARFDINDGAEANATFSAVTRGGFTAVLGTFAGAADINDWQADSEL